MDGAPGPGLKGKTAGGEVDVLEEVGAAIGRKGAVCQGLEDMIVRAQYGGAIGERAEVGGGEPESTQAAAGAQIEVMVITAKWKTSMCELAASGSHWSWVVEQSLCFIASPKNFYVV